MTAHYARLSDKTVREHWEKARKVNAEGQPVQIGPDGPLGDAAWSKHRLSRATQALPNGYCELPMVRVCPHASSCRMRTVPEAVASASQRCALSPISRNAGAASVRGLGLGWRGPFPPGCCG
jgi:hypothetical protein